MEREKERERERAKWMLKNSRVICIHVNAWENSLAHLPLEVIFVYTFTSFILKSVPNSLPGHLWMSLDGNCIGEV